MFEDVCKEKPPGTTCTKKACKKNSDCYGFYFDSKEEKCKTRMYQCRPWSRNKFKTLEECENKCLPDKGM